MPLFKQQMPGNTGLFRAVLASSTAFLAPTALAAAGAGAPPNAGVINLIMIGVLIAFFYLLIWRPQSKRRKEHASLMTGLGKGDEVVSAGGIVGTITKIEDDFVKLKLAQNVEIRLQKSAIGATLPKGTLKSLDNE